MSSPITERLQQALSQGRWHDAALLLRTASETQAAQALGHLPFEQQQVHASTKRECEDSRRYFAKPGEAEWGC